MNDPKRLREQSTSSLTADLLAAAAEEAPAPEVRQRALQAVLAATSVGALAAQAAAAPLPVKAATAAAKLSVAPGAGSAAALTKSTVLTAVMAKWLGVSVVSLSALAGAPHVYQWLTRAEPQAPRALERSAEPSRRDQPAPQAAPPALAPLPSDAEPEPAHTTGAPAAAVAPEQARPRRRSAPAPRTLSAELTRVDEARARLQRGDAAGTLSELAGYEAEFPRAQLGLEVTMLRMEASLAAGQPERARALARQLLARGASPAHTARARAVLLETSR